MTSFIIVSSEKTKRREYIDNYCKELGIDPLDVTIIEKETAIKQNINSIGIEEIINMQKKLFLKPIKSPVKAIVIEEAQLLTVQAQNSMLKILEEPPDKTIILLSAETSEAFLPTIISRCKIIELEQEKQKINKEENDELIAFVENLTNMPISEKLKVAEIQAKDKDNAIEWAKKVILVLREKILKNYTSDTSDDTASVNALKQFQTLHKLLKTTNVNARFAIENAILSINN